MLGVLAIGSILIPQELVPTNSKDPVCVVAFKQFEDQSLTQLLMSFRLWNSNQG